jgi:hypothetical protein
MVNLSLMLCSSFGTCPLSFDSKTSDSLKHCIRGSYQDLSACVNAFARVMGLLMKDMVKSYAGDGVSDLVRDVFPFTKELVTMVRIRS